MMDTDIACTLRLVGLIGLALSFAGWAWAEGKPSRKGVLWMAAASAMVFGLLYFLGVLAGGDSGARRLLPRFP